MLALSGLEGGKTLEISWKWTAYWGGCGWFTLRHNMHFDKSLFLSQGPLLNLFLFWTGARMGRSRRLATAPFGRMGSRAPPFSPSRWRPGATALLPPLGWGRGRVGPLPGRGALSRPGAGSGVWPRARSRSGTGWASRAGPGPRPRTGAGGARGRAGAGRAGAALLFLDGLLFLVAGVQVVLWQVTTFLIIIII